VLGRIAHMFLLEGLSLWLKARGSAKTNYRQSLTVSFLNSPVWLRGYHWQVKSALNECYSRLPFDVDFNGQEMRFPQVSTPARFPQALSICFRNQTGS